MLESANPTGIFALHQQLAVSPLLRSEVIGKDDDGTVILVAAIPGSIMENVAS